MMNATDIPDEVWANWAYAQEDGDEGDHGYNCICETCLQNYPERDIEYGDGTYFKWDDDVDIDE